MDHFAHRGLSGEAPENTAAAFRLAHKEGFQWIELDVLITRDQQPILFHDDDLTPFGHAVRISEQPLGYLLSLDMGGWFSDSYQGERLLTLDDALSLANELNLGVNVELKPELLPALAGEFGERLSQRLNTAPSNAPAPYILSSFHPSVLNWARKHCPDLPRAVLVEGPLTRAHEQLAEAIDATAIHLDDDHTDADTLRHVLNSGWTPRVYTVNDLTRARQLADSGCAGIFTDCLLPDDTDKGLGA